MKTIILDTNFLMIPYQNRIDIFSELERMIPEKYELVAPEGVIKELQQIQDTGSGSEKIAAKIALELIEKKGVKAIESHGNVDESILDFIAKNKDSIVCTNDKELKRKLRKSHTPIICLKGKNRLEFSDSDLN